MEWINPIVVLILLFLGWGVWENVRHRRRLEKIRIRIHVNGTRGKSSVTRLIAAALREAEIRTFAKTTGSAARMIFEDGSELPVLRDRKPNIIEQLKIVKRAHERGVNALVIECMAIQPQLQRVSEEKIIRSTLGVITNARPDHLEEMGPGVDDVAHSLANTLPHGGLAFTAERRMARILRERADARGTTLIETSDNPVTDEEMAGFDHVEHEDNVALALAVARHLGVDRATALRGMHRVRPDLGALKVAAIDLDGKEMTFVNAFAANDPESTLAIWRRVTRFRPEAANVFLLNTREDRFDRSEHLVEMIHRHTDYARLLLVGENTQQLLASCYRKGLQSDKVVRLGAVTATEIARALKQIDAEAITLFGIGNVHGGGEEIAHYFTQRSAA